MMISQDPLLSSVSFISDLSQLISSFFTSFNSAQRDRRSMECACSQLKVCRLMTYGVNSNRGGEEQLSRKVGDFICIEPINQRFNNGWDADCSEVLQSSPFIPKEAGPVFSTSYVMGWTLGN
jgi:hypothetical protein